MAGSRGAVEDEIADELARHGANRVAIAGVLGNSWRESLDDPRAEGTGGGGLLGNTAGAVSLANLKRAGGRRWGDPRFQIDFMLKHGGAGLIPKMNRAKSPEEAAKIFMDEWEHPGVPALGERERAARYSYERLGRVGGGGSRPGAPASGPRDTSSGSAVDGSAGDLMHVGLTGALVLGGAGLVGLGVTRMFGSAARPRGAPA